MVVLSNIALVEYVKYTDREELLCPDCKLCAQVTAWECVHAYRDPPMDKHDIVTCRPSSSPLRSAFDRTRLVFKDADGKIAEETWCTRDKPSRITPEVLKARTEALLVWVCVLAVMHEIMLRRVSFALGIEVQVF